MANLDAPRGLIPRQNEGKVLRVREYDKTAAEEIFKGDLVMRVAAGTISKYTAGNVPLGVAAEYSAAASTAKVAVYDDPEGSYVIQTADAYAVADNGLNADIVDTETPVLNQSAMELDMSSKAVTATLPLKIMGLAPLINNAANDAGVNADVIVKLNNSERGAGQVGI